MRLVHALGAAVAATTLVASVAQATLTTSLVQIPVNSGAASAISSQPVRTYQLKVTQTAGEKFDVGNLQVTLANTGGLSGYFYADPTVHSNTTGESKPYLAPGQTPSNASFYDTYVTTPAFEATPTAGTAAAHLNVTGSADWPVGPGSITPVVPQTGGNTVGSNQTMNIVWGDQSGNQAATVTDGTVSYTVAQFTIVGNTGAFLRGYFGGSAASNTAQFFSPTNATGGLDTALAALNSGKGGAVYLPILGDIGKDGTVGSPDLNAVLNNFGLNANGDANADGQTGSPDLNAVLNNFGNSISAPGAGAALGSVVPEPASLSLLGLAGLLAVRRRK